MITYDNSLKSKYPFPHYKEAIFSPSTGIFDSHSFIHSLSRDFQSLGGNILLGNETLNVEQSSKGYEVYIQDKNTENQFVVITNILVNSAGLNAVHIANLVNEGNTYQEEFVKGEYYIYQGKEKLENLIYPTPSENSLGLHATIDLGKGIRFGLLHMWMRLTIISLHIKNLVFLRRFSLIGPASRLKILHLVTLG